jgi:hypothetical protein
MLHGPNSLTYSPLSESPAGSYCRALWVSGRGPKVGRTWDGATRSCMVPEVSEHVLGRSTAAVPLPLDFGSVCSYPFLRTHALPKRTFTMMLLICFVTLLIGLSAWFISGTDCKSLFFGRRIRTDWNQVIVELMHYFWPFHLYISEDSYGNVWTNGRCYFLFSFRIS